MSFLSISEKLGDFKTSMDAGAIYFEFSDGSCTAMHEDVFNTTAVISGIDRFIYREFIDSKIASGLEYSKIYYKSFNRLEPDLEAVWVDLSTLFSNGYTNIWQNIAYGQRSFIAVDPSNIKKVDYTDSAFRIHNIDACDGTYNFGTDVPAFIYPIRDNDRIEIKPYNSSIPTMVDTEHLMDDLIITCLDSGLPDMEDLLVYIGGIFVPYVKKDSRTIIIPKGKSLLDTIVKDYVATERLPYVGSSNTASVDLDGVVPQYRYDFNIRIFKWKDISVTSPVKPSLVDYNIHKYTNPDTGNEHNIDCPNILFFSHPIKDHFLLKNGIVVDPDDYEVQDSKILLNGMDALVKRVGNDIHQSDPNNPRLGNLIEKELPMGSDYELIVFVGEGVKMHRSDKVFKNYPYPYHVTFKEFVQGDIVLIDGLYEPYLTHSRNSIRYHLTDYMTFNGDETNHFYGAKIERVWFGKY